MVHPKVLILAQSGVCIGFMYTVFNYFYHVSPLQVPALPSVAERLTFTLRWQTISAITMMFGVYLVGFGRFVSEAYDPIHGKVGLSLTIDKNYLQNTLEQFLLNSIGQLILTTYLAPNQMHAIPILVLFFTLGRVLYWIGYRRVHYARAFGFAMTWLPTNAIYVANLVLFMKSDYIGILLGGSKLTGLP